MVQSLYVNKHVATYTCTYIIYCVGTEWSPASFLITVKEATRQRKEAKLIKQLEKQRQQEAAEIEKLEEQQNKNGKATVLSCAAVCSSARAPVKS